MADKHPLSAAEINRLLLVNSELLCTIQQEANQRKNKNMLTPSLANLICEYERNLMRICLDVEPGSMADPQVIDKEKVMFHKIQQKKPQTQQPPSQQQRR